MPITQSVKTDSTGTTNVLDNADGIVGSAVGTTVIQVGGTDGATIREVRTDANGVLYSNQKIPIIPLAPTSATVGTTSITVVAANAGRTGVIFTNLSANHISIAFNSNTAVINKGITLLPNDRWAMDHFSFTNTVITAVASAANSALSIQEYN